MGLKLPFHASFGLVGCILLSKIDLSTHSADSPYICD